VVRVQKSGVHYFNMGKIAYTRAGWVLSLPNTIGILFLIWTNGFFQEHYAGFFLNKSRQNIMSQDDAIGNLLVDYLLNESNETSISNLTK
jgi:hypothetical protein